MRGQRFAAVGLCVLIAVNQPLAQQVIHFQKVDYFEGQAEESEKRDARLILDPKAKVLLVTDEKNPGQAMYLQIPYEAITSVSYSNSKHPRWKSGTGAAVAVGVFALPIFFMSGKKHWLSLTFDAELAPQYPMGYAFMQLDKNNYMPILAAIEGQTGMKVERIVEE